MAESFDIQLLTNLTALKNADTKDLERLVRKYPYFQTAHILLAKHYHANDNSHFEGFLKKTSSLASDRTRLYEIIHDWSITDDKIEGRETPTVQVEAPSPIEDSSDDEIIDLIEQAEEAIQATELAVAKEEDLIENVILELPKEEKKEEIDSIEDETIEEVQEVIDETPVANAHTGRKMSFLDWIKSYNGDHVEEDLNESSDIIEDTDEIEEEEITVEIVELPKEEKTEKIEEEVSSEDIKEEEIELEANLDYQFDLPKRTPLQSFVEKEEASTEDIIDKFLELDKKQTITPKFEEETPKKAPTNKKSSKKEFGMVSETLAIIHAKQGKLDKAIELYEQLILQEPKKSTYFVAQIEKLKKLQ